MLFLEIIIGGLTASAFLYLLHFGKENVLRGILALALAVASLIYAGFAVFGLWTKSANFSLLLLEILGVGIYFLFAFLGVKKSVWFLATGLGGSRFMGHAFAFRRKCRFRSRFLSACLYRI